MSKKNIKRKWIIWKEREIEKKNKNLTSWKKTELLKVSKRKRKKEQWKHCFKEMRGMRGLDSIQSIQIIQSCSEMLIKIYKCECK